MSQTPGRECLVRVPLAELHEGVQLIGEVALLRQGDVVRATRARCRHMNGKMRHEGGCRLRCPHHGWVLDMDTMAYVDPEGATHPELRVDRAGLDVRVFEDDESSSPWGPARKSRELPAGELVLRFYAHACLELEAGPTRVFTDPWLCGPAFTRGWWLTHDPPPDWLDRLANADAIFISHNHSDHLNPPTLARLHSRNASVRLVVPTFESGSTARELVEMGFTNVEAVPFDEWQDVGGIRFMVLEDRTDRDDSAILFDYDGYRVLDTVDCHNLGPLPEVDVLLAQHTRGASGFPVCWEAQYGQAEIERRVARELRKAQQEILGLLEDARPRLFIPFAGYFTEAHPSDGALRERNRKNGADAVCAAARRRFEVSTWVPTSGGVVDVSTLDIEEGEPAHNGPSIETMAPYLSAIELDASEPALATTEGVQAYFDWAGFEGRLLLHIVEVDEHFAATHRELYVDFTTGRVAERRPSTELPYLCMRVRTSVFRHVLRTGKSWDEISIGFQARFRRDPDVYHFDFWNHFQHHLPAEPTTWDDLVPKPPTA